MMGNPKTILIIDDEEDLRETVAYNFKSKGYTVSTAIDGLDGLEQLEHLHPDLIVLDMNMPRMNGLEFYQKLRGDDAKPQYPVLVLTARANMEQLFRDLDVDGFMAKPFELDQLFKEADTIIKKAAGTMFREADSQEMRARRVCIVENKQDVSHKLALSFLDSGYIVNAAHSGASAIKRIGMDVPDVVVISLGLDDISGDIVIGKLRPLECAQNIRFVLYTDKAADADKTIITQTLSEKQGVHRLIVSSSADEIKSAADALFE